MANKTTLRIDATLYNEYLLKYLEAKYDISYYIKDPQVIIAGLDKYNKDNINPSLRLIARVGSGIDNIDLDYCKEHNIKIIKTPQEPANAVAEFTIGQIMYAQRKIDINMFYTKTMGTELSNRVVGVIGYGNIGRLVVDKLEKLGCNVIWADIKHKSMYSKNEIIKLSDIITLHIPLKDEYIDNHDFITKNELYMMKGDVILVNTSRGCIINEEDILYWLKKNPKSTYISDVFEQEPYTGPLLDLPNVMATPHIASYTKEAILAMEERIINNLLHEEL